MIQNLKVQIMFKYVLILIVLMATIHRVVPKKSKDNEKPDWAKKDIRDYSDADMERLLDQWEVIGAGYASKYHIHVLINDRRRTRNRWRMTSCRNTCVPCPKST